MYNRKVAEGIRQVVIQLEEDGMADDTADSARIYVTVVLGVL